MDIDERSWETIAADSVLMNAVSSWRKDPEKWLEKSIDRLNETVRVNPLRDDIEWVENTLTFFFFRRWLFVRSIMRCAMVRFTATKEQFC